jgi:hypothetical protein
MAGESQYYNPIIEAMIASTQNTERIKTREQQGKQHDAELKAKEKQQEQQQKQFEAQLKQEADFRNKQIDFESQRLKLESNRAAMDFMKTGRELVKEGGNEEAFLAQFPELAKQMPAAPMVQQNLGNVPQEAHAQNPVYTQELPEGAYPDPQVSHPVIGEKQGSRFYNPEVEAANVQRLAQAKLGPETEARKKLIDYENDFKKKGDEAERLWRSSESKLDRDSHERISANSLRAQSEHWKLQYGGSTPGQNSGMLLAGMTGRMKLDGSNPHERAILNQIYAEGGRPIDPKELNALKDSQKLLPFFPKMKAFAESLPENPVAAAASGSAKAFLQNKLNITTDQMNEMAQIKGHILNVGRALEGMTGRPLVAQLQIDLDSILSGTLSRKHATERWNNIAEMFRNNYDNVLLGGTSPEQKKLLERLEGIVPAFEVAPKEKPDPEFLKVAPKTNKAGHKLDRENSIKFGRPVYVP